MIRLLESLNAALAPLDPTRPEVAAAIQMELAGLSSEPPLECLLAARDRVWERVAEARCSPTFDTRRGDEGV